MFIVFVVYISFLSRFVSFLFVCTPFLLVSLTQPDQFVPHSSSTLLREFSLKLVYALWQHGAFKFTKKKSLKIYVIYYFFTNGWHPTTTTRRVISMEMQKTKQRARSCRVIGRSFAKPCSAFIVTTSSIGTENQTCARHLWDSSNGACSNRTGTGTGRHGRHRRGSHI